MTKNELLFSQLGELTPAERQLALEAIANWDRRVTYPYRPPWGEASPARRVVEIPNVGIVGIYMIGSPEQDEETETSLRFGYVHSYIRSKSPPAPPE